LSEKAAGNPAEPPNKRLKESILLSSYKKGYRLELMAIEYMKNKYGAVCVRSAGSHGPCDLLCGNGKEIFAVQVKGGGKKPPKIGWEDLERFAEMFKATPLLLWKPDRGRFVEIKGERGE